MKNNQHKFKIYKNGFTLAEVLITLVIVGVVAAMTIPTLINNTKQKQYIVAWRKAFSEFSQALLLVKANGDTLDDGITDKISGYMNAKPCTPENVKYTILQYDGSRHYENISEYSRCIALESGTYIGITANIVLFDINGGSKPNQIGKDIFFALVDKNNFKLNPAKGYKNGWGAADGVLIMPTVGDGTCQAADQGRGCSAWFLLHDK